MEMTCPDCYAKFKDPETEPITCPHCDTRWWSEGAIAKAIELTKADAFKVEKLVRGVELFNWKVRVHHSVYVVLLKNVPGVEAAACYVGQTGFSVEERLLNHKRKYKYSWEPHKYGVALLRSYFKHYNPMTWAESKEKENELFERFEDLGWKVYGGH